MIRHMRHGSPPRLMALQSILRPNRRESLPAPSAGNRMTGHGEEARIKNGPALAGHGAEAVCDAITRTIITLPEQLRRSLTWDQGAEMAQHARLKIDAGLQVY